MGSNPIGVSAVESGVLHVLHDRGGGTALHVHGLVGALGGRRHVIATVAGDRIELWLDAYPPDAYAPAATTTIERASGEPWREILRGIATRFGISLVHVHHLAASPYSLASALPTLGIPYGVTIHDLWFACPTVTLTQEDGHYCGGVTAEEVCGRCLAAQPQFASIDIARWRRMHTALLDRASFVIAPSAWASGMLVRYFPVLADRITIVPHALAQSPSGRAAEVASGPGGRVSRAPFDRPEDDWPVVAFIGAIGPDKGARRIERLAAIAGERDVRIRFVVIGYLDVHHQPWQSADRRLTVHGHYARNELAGLVARYRPRFVCFPSEGPESFSYTLSETWSERLPALVPPIGALAERVAQTGAGWILDETEWRSDAALLDRIVALAEAQDDAAFAAARAVTLPSVASMAEATAACYRAAQRSTLPDTDRAPTAHSRLLPRRWFDRMTPRSLVAAVRARFHG